MVTPIKWRQCIPAWIWLETIEPVLKVAAFVALGAPLGWLCVAVIGELSEPGSRLGADPGEAVVLFLGEWSIRMLLLTLSISSLRRLLRQPRLLRLRRMVGLFAFTYVTAHLLAYLGFLLGFEWRLIGEEVVERSYITVGFAAFALLIPLAVTSIGSLRRRLGRNWARLHRVIYLIVMLGLLHLFWLTKDGYGEAIFYLCWFVLLMLERLLDSRRRRVAIAG